MDNATLSALHTAVGSDREVSGQHGQALFAAHGRLGLAEELPEPPMADSARFTSIPDVLPLVLQHSPDIPHVAVALCRAFAETDREEDLHAFGVHTGRQEPAGAVVVGALVGTGAELITVPREELPLEDGVGVLLRYHDPYT
ncbi:hypothetical protein JBE04_06560 [Streptomyces sp. PRKS01-29]|nr:hypothetical protein [Streptomyces sabulosicollis]MBI0294150.1 hypothetical protein [Streptomyces sabulosicollis]